MFSHSVHKSQKYPLGQELSFGIRLEEDGSMMLGRIESRLGWSGQLGVPGIPVELQQGGRGNDRRKFDVGSASPSAGVSRKKSSSDRAEWGLRLITYNANSVKQEATRQYLDRLFSRASVQLVGIQEARCFAGPRARTLHYECFCSPSVNGSLGRQLWIKRGAAVATLDEGGHACFDVDHVVILEASPRLLVAVVGAGKQRFACIFAHAPTSGAEASCIQTWWAQTRAAIRKLPRNVIPLLFLDANARFESWTHGGALQGTPKGNNAVELQTLLLEHEMDTCHCMDACGNPVVTWVAPGGQHSMIDYIVMPQNLADIAVTVGLPPSFVDCGDVDHRPLQVNLTWRAAAAPSIQKKAWDRKLMMTEWGRQQLSEIYRSLPVIGWDVDLDVHLQRVNEHLFAGLKQSFLKEADTPRQPQSSNEQWSVIQRRRQARRMAHRSKGLRSRVWLHALLVAWRGCAQSAHGLCQDEIRKQVAAARLVKARCGLVVQECNKLIKRLSERDAAVYATETMRVAKKEGPEALARAMRAVLKCGRRYAAPKVQTALVVDGRTVVDKREQLVAFEDSFAIPENGKLATVQDLLGVDGVELCGAIASD